MIKSVEECKKELAKNKELKFKAEIAAAMHSLEHAGKAHTTNVLIAEKFQNAGYTLELFSLTDIMIKLGE